MYLILTSLNFEKTFKEDIFDTPIIKSEDNSYFNMFIDWSYSNYFADFSLW